jgi:hypothetical protein
MTKKSSPLGSFPTCLRIAGRKGHPVGYFYACKNVHKSFWKIEWGEKLNISLFGKVNGVKKCT